MTGRARGSSGVGLGVGASVAAGLLLVAASLAWGGPPTNGGSPPAGEDTLAAANARLLDRLQRVHHLDDAAMERIRAVFAASPYIGQGNPAVTRHPLTPAECTERARAAGVTYENPTFTRICGGPYQAPLYDPATQRPEDAIACIDQFEFPDLPCEYPVVWVRASEAAEICAAEGRRLCDAHEWEGACAGALEPPDYRFDLAAGHTALDAVSRMRAAHNARYRDPASRAWSYGDAYEAGVCAAASEKSPGCNGGSWTQCGSNTYPAGSFPGCVSPLGVYDENGNAAEHMNLPLNAAQMSSAGATRLGVTEMKGSWFIFDHYRAHEDWCRWRAPYWHGGPVQSPDSHRNYHLGFRCCKTLPERPSGPDASPRR